MSTAEPVTGLTIDESVLAALDFEPFVPCDRPRHVEGRRGCDPEAPAAWVVMVAHSRSMETCEPFLRAVCADGFEHMNREVAEFFTVPAAAIILCASCHIPITKPEQLLTLIGKV